MADFCLQFESVEWVAIAGHLDGNLVVAVRNHGTGRGNAGDLVKRIFGDIGNAGGHRNMAKAVIPLRQWRQREGKLNERETEARLRQLFMTALRGDSDGTNGRPAPHREG